ncbi:peptidoglycan bridge formation glycyltransferase FemA/FemB family protein [Carnobacteriaceae bacterium zg-84]|uniref:peptidoglycan bridge formation glycyltransferase FemA/FemB family protein n=1 Tax=Granulicatella sp. zg-84 TaxID=2678503 RepID=UPI0013BECD7D|nr:peptidoglycan bridge formation glycyltransferase FemA/FemB family protein [Granulicatella sp. zg-84]NEW65776.1 peptidoglycan bridge formation glycyltransferase FemA/FemB family protein [Granulicatella sp. zg-84]QMI86284.1 peptidoglycan bridge formation glycyltransferase FemA/FemB family protein [Carnobacteriaceae bacterium zg-84]
MYTFKTDIDEQSYDIFVEQHPMGNLLQTAKWASVKSEWQSVRTAVYQDNQMVGAALILIRTIKGFKFGYIPRGPIIDYDNQALVSFYMNELNQFAKKNKWLFIKFDPRIVRKSAPFKVFPSSPVLSDSLEKVNTLTQKGIRYLGLTTSLYDTVQPRFEAILDVEQFDEKALSSKVRNCIKASRKRDVVITSYDEEGADLLNHVIQKTMARKHIQLRGADYFRLIKQLYQDKADFSIAEMDVATATSQLKDKINALTTQMTSGNYRERKVKLLQEELTLLEKRLSDLNAMPVEDKAIMSGGLSVGCGHVLEQIYAGFDEQYKQFYPQYLLYVSFVEYAKKQGYTRVNLGGIENNLEGGLIRFKAKFNPIIEEYVGEFDLVVSPLYYAVQFALNMRKRLKKKG